MNSNAPLLSTSGLVVLPDHLHAVWKLPEGNVDYSNRWRRIKGSFSRALPRGECVSANRAAKGERGLWQRRFWEHTVQDEDDLRRLLDYLHFNPVKHGLVANVADPHFTLMCREGNVHRTGAAEVILPAGLENVLSGQLIDGFRCTSPILRIALL
jgi:REP element-mobilizing transposase RayT